MNKPIVIAVTGSPPDKACKTYGDFSQWVQGDTHPSNRFCVVDATRSPSFPDINTISGVIITGSAAMVTDREPWSLLLEEWVQHLVLHEIPVLGICYGHQLVAQALGGKVDFHPLGREIGSVPIELTKACEKDPLFSRSPFDFIANVTHAQSVVDLPPNSVLLAKNAYEPNHAFRVGSCTWGVQFHPEFTANIMRFYFFERFDSLEQQGLSIKSLFSEVQETPESRSVLDNFIALCMPV